jgi:hypothetical protein
MCHERRMAASEPDIALGANRVAGPPIELGWVLAGATSETETLAVQQAVELMSGYLTALLPGFDWRVTLATRREANVAGHVDPMALVDIGVVEREAARWDFVFVVTHAPLVSHAKPFMLGAPAHALDVAILSTARLDPAALGGVAVGGRGGAVELHEQDRKKVLARRIAALAMHLFGHLIAIPHSDDPRDFSFALADERDLDAMSSLAAAGDESVRGRLAEVADPRLEETQRGSSKLRFYWQALWLNRGEVLSGITRIAPWWFPIRYSRLTTAAASTLLILIMTAEAWELGMSQPGWRVSLLSALCLVSTSYYILYRQRLLQRLGRGQTEQRAVTIASVSVSVLLGMMTTYALLFSVTWFAAKLLFRAELVRQWAASIPTITSAEYLSLAAFIACAGISIGALGASFEQESYFRRVAILDEET